MTDLPSASNDPGGRVVLEGVPRIGYHLHLCPFPGSLFACMQYIGDPCSYDFLMAVSGGAFRRFWNRDDGGNVDLMYLKPEPYQRVFRALGYAYDVVGTDDKAALITALKRSIAKGRPALGFGIIGPPECDIVAGYDRGGEVLIGFSYFQDSSIQGYYERDTWYERAAWASGIGFIVLGAKGSRPSERDVLVSTLEWAVDLARTPVRPGRPDHSTGLAAYEGWAAGLEIDADYPRDNAEVLRTRVMVHGDQAMMLEDRRSAARYLRGMVEKAPEAAEDLNAAAGLYDQVVDQMGGLWLWGSNMGPEVGQALVDRETRCGISRHIRAARDFEARAVQRVEKALKTLNGNAEGRSY
jgi:hypothetical protein